MVYDNIGKVIKVGEQQHLKYSLSTAKEQHSHVQDQMLALEFSMSPVKLCC